MSAPNRSPRRYLSLIFMITGLTLIFPASNTAMSGFSWSDSQERKIEVVENAWPSNVLELVKVHNLQAESFPDGFQVEVKNISDKPIYFIGVAVVMPDSRQYFSNSRSGSFHVTYGNPKLGKSGALPQAEDVHIKPGETGMLRADRYTAERFFDKYPNGDKIRKYGTYHLRLLFQSLSFGDGSGYLLQNKYSAQLPPEGNRNIKRNAFMGSSPVPDVFFVKSQLTRISH